MSPEPIELHLPMTPLHPVWENYGLRFQQQLAETMGGPRASPYFASLVSTADLHYRLLIATGTGLDLEPDAAQQWNKVALDGALLAFTQMTGESMARGEQMSLVYGFLGILVNPGVRLTFRNGHLLDAERAGGRLQRRLERLALDEDEEEHVPCDWCNPPRSQVGAGLDWDLEESEKRGKHDSQAPTLNYNAWFSYAWRQPSGVQAQVALVTWEWSLSARQRLWDDVSLLASLKSPQPDPDHPFATPPDPVPRQAVVGLSYHLPGDWSVRLDRRTDLADQSWTWMLSVHSSTRTPIPAQTGPHLGGVDPEIGLQLPELQPSEPLLISNTAAPP